MISKFSAWYRDFIEEAQRLFSSELYQRDYGISDRFPSVLSAVMRFLLKYLHIVVVAVWVMAIVIGAGEDIPFFGKVLVSPIAAALYCAMILFAFFVLMLLESCCKILVSLILFDELPNGAENPPDAILMSIVSKRF